LDRFGGVDLVVVAILKPEERISKRPGRMSKGVMAPWGKVDEKLAPKQGVGGDQARSGGGVARTVAQKGLVD